MSSYASQHDGDPPFIDEHRTVIPAPRSVVWRSLVRHITRTKSGAAMLARLLGANPRSASQPGPAAGQPFGEGTTVPGFAVTKVTAEQQVRLVGRHRFSRYELVYTLTGQPDGTVLSTRTYAEFPGPHGRLYRALVIGSGAHRVVVARMLADIRRHAEAHSVD